MKRTIFAASMPEETDYKKERKMKRIFLSTAVFLAGILASSESHALIACAPNAIAENWYCHNSDSTAPNVGSGTTSHGYGDYYWCYAGGGWTFFRSYTGNGSTNACGLFCPGDCNA
jgi:hypothetical protein